MTVPINDLLRISSNWVCFLEQPKSVSLHIPLESTRTLAPLISKMMFVFYLNGLYYFNVSIGFLVISLLYIIRLYFHLNFHILLKFIELILLIHILEICRRIIHLCLFLNNLQCLDDLIQKAVKFLFLFTLSSNFI